MKKKILLYVYRAAAERENISRSIKAFLSATWRIHKIQKFAHFCPNFSNQEGGGGRIGDIYEMTKQECKGSTSAGRLLPCDFLGQDL